MMRFRFTIKQAIRIAGVDIVAGTLESGALLHGMAATAQTRLRPVPLRIRTVVFITPRGAPNEYILTIYQARARAWMNA